MLPKGAGCRDKRGSSPANARLSDGSRARPVRDKIRILSRIQLSPLAEAHYTLGFNATSTERGDNSYHAHYRYYRTRSRNIRLRSLLQLTVGSGSSASSTKRLQQIS